ncbi:hypothetical protein J8TS2_24090 [Lederbergia ruris]|uniref:Phytoene synthase n=1 Tax=Lederbergia ruris TaxID=217495 RepID=A0ABQ4KJF2_9BACI|nr:hypothetical protein [Lederbergia ruris]GIN58090.1 hypothetical protein J8TS2_24090 [Lederbergia ruris]
MNNVITNLEALASGIGKQDADTTASFYHIASQRLLETEAERNAFRYGALAMFADVSNQRLRAAYYRRKFGQAIKRI